MIVAKITTDHLFDKWNAEGGEHNNHSEVGREFDTASLREWWGWPDDQYNDNYFQLAIETDGQIPFRLFDDDGELYYSGELVDDDQCMVQQFVLGWAERDSGCTKIEVFRKDLDKYVEEIS